MSKISTRVITLSVADLIAKVRRPAARSPGRGAITAKSEFDADADAASCQYGKRLDPTFARCPPVQAKSATFLGSRQARTVHRTAACSSADAARVQHPHPLSRE